MKESKGNYMDNKPTFIMLVGLPGMGKDTFIGKNMQQITDKFNVQHYISSDDVIQDVADSLNKTYTEVFFDTITIANKFVDVMLSVLSLSKLSFINNQTNLTNHGRRAKLDKLFNKNEYNKIAVIFDEVGLAELRQRLDKRGIETGKIITDKLIDEMLGRYEVPTPIEGWDKIYTVAEFKALLDSPSNAYSEMKFA